MRIEKDNHIFIISEKTIPYTNERIRADILWDLDLNDYFLATSYHMWKDEILSAFKSHKASRCKKILACTKYKFYPYILKELNEKTIC